MSANRVHSLHSMPIAALLAFGLGTSFGCAEKRDLSPNSVQEPPSATSTQQTKPASVADDPQVQTQEACFSSERQRYLRHENTLPDDIALAVGEKSGSPIGALASQERYAREVVYAEGSPELGSPTYSFVVNSPAGKVSAAIEFSTQEKNLHVKEVYVLSTTDSRPQLTETHEYSYSLDCQRTESSIRTEQYQYQKTNDVLLKIDVVKLGVAEPQKQVKVDKEKFINSFYLTHRSFGDLLKSSHLNRGPFLATLLSDDTGPTEMTLNLTKLQPLSRQDHGATTVCDGAKLVAEQFPMAVLSYSSQDGKNQVELLLMNGNLNKKVEWVSKESWIKNPLDTSAKIIGLTNTDILQDELKLKISGVGQPTEFFNWRQYMTIDDQTHDGNTWSITARYENRVESSVAVPLDTPVSREEAKYLAPTLVIQTSAVTDIARNIRQKLGNTDRLTAAKAVTTEVVKRMTYDATTQTLPRTTEILKSGRGVCYHFSVLFASIARALGIPTRIISGYIPREDLLGSHAWVEVKINDSTWLPLEPQSDGGALFQRGYIPLQDSSSFDSVVSEFNALDFLHEFDESQTHSIVSVQKVN